MNTKLELAQRAASELITAANAMSRAASLFRVIRTALIEDEECSQHDVLALLDIGIELCGTYSDRATGEVVVFEDAESASQSLSEAA